MSERYVVVDGSNIATEGRETPSLAQLDAAVRAFMQERASDEELIVVVDATFGHRIDPSEKAEYEQAERAGEIVSPPAGAIGRGDAFLLQVADRTQAVVLSNDSFQEFHAEYPWLFDEGRLIGGKPVPRVGWFFTARTPVRGPKSREAMRAAKKARKASVRRAVVDEGPVAAAIAEATAEAISPDRSVAPDLSEDDGDGDGDGEGDRGGRSRRRRRAKPVGAVNDPLPFIQFIADHPLGSEVEAEVESFTSHGAFVRAGEARCYLPLSALADPAPRTAKAVLTRGEVRTFVVQALDPPRRGIELAMPGVARVAGTPTEETVEADIGAGRKASRAREAHDGPVGVPIEPAAGRRTRKKAAAIVAAEVGAAEVVAEAVPEVAKARRSRQRATQAEAEVEVEVAPAAAGPAKRARKAAKAVAAEVAAPRAPVLAADAEPEPAPEPLPRSPRRSRKAVAPAAGDATMPPPGPPPEPASEPQPEPKPKRTRKAAPTVELPAAAPVAPPARRSRKAAAEAPAVVAEPVKATRKRAAAKKASPAVPAAEHAEAVPAPVKRSRKKSAG